MEKDQEISFLPFHALNEFMLDDYRREIIQTVLHSVKNLTEKQSKAINTIIKKFVKIPGFRNSLKAPVGLKIKNLANAFEKNPEVVAGVVNAWADVKSSLKLLVYDFLRAHNWELLPLEADRSKLPGFLITWPTNQDFEELYIAFNEMFPENNAEKNDVSLMIVWVSLRLPYKYNDNHQNGN